MPLHLTVRSKLVLSSLVLLVVVSFVFTAAFLRLSEQWVEEELRARAIAFAREFAATIGDRREFENTGLLRGEIQRIMEARSAVGNIDILALGSGWPRLVVSSDPTWRPALTGEQVRDLDGGRVVARLVRGPDSRHWEVVAPIQLEGSITGAVAVEFSLAQADRQAARVRRTSLVITGASVLVAVLLMSLAARRVVHRPIQQFLRAIARVERGDLSTGVGLARTDEFGALAGHFDRMLTRLRQASAEREERVRQATAELAERYGEVRRLNELLFQVQRRLRHSERLALMGRTLSVVAHEVGTPLHSVAGHLELLRQELPAPVREGAVEHRLTVIQAQLVRVTETIERLLAASRRPSGERVLLDLNDRLGEVLDLVSPGLSAGPVRVETDLSRTLPAVAGDAHQLEQAFLNIVTNALDAMAAGGVLRVATEPELREGRRWAVVRVSDSGPGIPEEHLTHIFEPFFTTKEAGKGVGLGLFITHQVVREHGGEIDVETAEGKGATIVLAFPGADA